MKKYLLVALDLDGTLLNSEKKILPETITDLTEAYNKGIQIVYCTGRAPAEMKEYLPLLPMIQYGVCMSGSLVYDFKNQTTIYSNALSKELAKQIIEVAKEDDGMIQYMTEKDSIVREDQITHMVDFDMEIYQPMYLETAKTVKDMEKELENHESIPKLNIYFHSTKAREEAFEKLKLKNLPISITFGDKTALEMTATNVTKGNGLIELASYLKIPMDQIIGMGDNHNDCSFLEVVGFPIAMFNATYDLKLISRDITDDNNHNGTGKAIRNYC